MPSRDRPSRADLYERFAQAIDLLNEWGGLPRPREAKEIWDHFWYLEAHYSNCARRKPLAYAAAVTEGLRRSVDGDTGYSGLLTKNPTHDDWDALWCTNDRLYELDELAEHLTEAGYMPPASWKRTKRRNQVGLGRNCSIFETARTWAYREIRHHWYDPQGLHDAISAHVNEPTTEFPEPLPASETRAIAASIHRWITTKSRMWADGPTVYEATFSTIQAARGRKGAEQRANNVRQRIFEEMA